MALQLDSGNSRSTAIMLLVIAVLLVYLLCFHWFILRHIDYGSEIADLSDQLNRFTEVASHAGYLTHGRVRFFGRGRVHTGADAATLRAGLQGRYVGFRYLAASWLTNKLVNCRH